MLFCEKGCSVVFTGLDKVNYFNGLILLALPRALSYSRLAHDNAINEVISVV